MFANALRPPGVQGACIDNQGLTAPNNTAHARQSLRSFLGDSLHSLALVSLTHIVARRESSRIARIRSYGARQRRRLGTLGDICGAKNRTKSARASGRRAQKYSNEDL